MTRSDPNPSDPSPLRPETDGAGGPESARTGAASRRPLIVNPHRKLPVWLWVIPLVIVVAAIILLPHLLERLI